MRVDIYDFVVKNSVGAMSYRSLPGDDQPSGGECRNFVDALIAGGGPSGMYSHYEQRLMVGRAGIGLSLVMNKVVKVSEMYSTADTLKDFSMRVDVAVSRRQCTHVSYIGDASLREGTAVSSKGVADGGSLQSTFGQYSLERSLGLPPQPLETKAAIISSWNSLLSHIPLAQPTTMDFSHAWVCAMLSAINFVESIEAMQTHQIGVFWTGNLATVNILGSRRNALGFGHQLASGLIAGTVIVLELPSAVWERIGWMVRLLFSGAPSVTAFWPHNAGGQLVLPAPMEEWQRGAGPVVGGYRPLHSCFQAVSPPEIYVMYTDDNGQIPPDNSMQSLQTRGYPPIFLPGQQFLRQGNELAVLYETLQVLSRQMPDAAAIESAFVNVALRYLHIPNGDAHQPADMIGASPGVSPAGDSMFRGGIIKLGRGPTVMTYLQDVWDAEELRASASLTMGKVQRLLADISFRTTPLMFQVSAVMQFCMVQALRLLCVTPPSLIIDGPWLSLDGRDERAVARHCLGQLQSSDRSDVSILAEETLERAFGLKVAGKFWRSVNCNYTVLQETYPHIVAPSRYPAPATGLDRHILVISCSPLFLHPGLISDGQEEGLEYRTYDGLSATLKGAALSNDFFIAVDPSHRSRLAGDAAATILVPPTNPTGSLLARFLPIGSIWGRAGARNVQATTCTVRNADEGRSTSSRVNAAYANIQTPAWAAFTDTLGGQLPPNQVIFKAEYLRYAELDSSDLFFYQYHITDEFVRRCINSQSRFEELVPYTFMFKAFSEGKLVPTLLAIERPIINVLEARRRSKRAAGHREGEQEGKDHEETAKPKAYQICV